MTLGAYVWVELAFRPWYDTASKWIFELHRKISTCAFAVLQHIISPILHGYQATERSYLGIQPQRPNQPTQFGIDL